MDKNTPTKCVGKLFDEYENELLIKARTEKAMEYGMDKNTPTKCVGKLFDEYENELLTKARTERALENVAELQTSKLIDSIKKKFNNGKR